jgi:hypothetical protein
MIQLFILHPCPSLEAPFAANWDSPADSLSHVRYGCFHERSVLCLMRLLLSEESTQAIGPFSSRGQYCKETTQIPSFVRSYSKQQFHWLGHGLKL